MKMTLLGECDIPATVTPAKIPDMKVNLDGTIKMFTKGEALFTTLPAICEL